MPSPKSRRKGQAVLQGMLAISAYAAFAFVVATAARHSLDRLGYDGVSAFDQFSMANLGCIYYRGASLRSSARFVNVSKLFDVEGGRVGFRSQAVRCDYNIEFTPSLVIQDRLSALPA